MVQFEEQEVVRWEKGEIRSIKDDIVVESSLELVVDGRFVVTLLCSPMDQKVLAVGYLKSEGLIEGRENVREVNYDPEDKLIELETDIRRDDLEEYFDRKRALTSSCGRASAVIEKLGDLKFDGPGPGLSPQTSQLTELMKGLQRKAELFQRTGGSHTAALAVPGEIEYLAEDIGRHNAADKVIGKAVLENRNLEEMILLTSGRLSSEMVLKAIQSSISPVVSRSAPTTLAVRMAKMTGLGLVGFVRGQRLTVYSGEERFKELS